MSPSRDIDGIRAANDEFYRAFERLDLRAMEDVWAHGEEVRCVHPGWPPLTGWAEVRESWQTIFANTSSIAFQLSDVQVVTAGELAWVFLIENIASEVGGGLAQAKVIATNLFERQGGRWRMVLHHASPAPTLVTEVDEAPPAETDPTMLN